MALSLGNPTEPGRRLFLRAASGAALALVLPRQSLASDDSQSVLVCVNLVGGLDGLSVLVPYGEDAYYRARPTTFVPPAGKSGGALRVSDGFGLHPNLASLHEMYLKKQLAIVPAAGGAHFGRSHFATREAMARAASTEVRDGWANRYAQARSALPGSSCLFSTTSDLPRAMAGEAATEMASDYDAFSKGKDRSSYLEALRRLYEGNSDPFARSADRALRLAAEVRDKAKGVRLHGDYGHLGGGLRGAARLIRANVGARIVWVQIGGFDTHKSQGGARGQLAEKLAQLGQAITAFREDLGPGFSDVALVTMTEFGRTLGETGGGGTDHGSASCMLVLGGRVRGGRLTGRWPGLDRASLRDERELAVTTDYRAVLSDLLVSHLGLDAASLAQVFPDFDAAGQEPLGLVAPRAS